MKKNVSIFVAIVTCVVLLCSCGEQGSAPTTTSDTTVTTTAEASSTTTVTATTTTTTITTKLTTTTAEQDKFPGVVVNVGGFVYLKLALGLKSTGIIPTAEFLEKYPTPLPSGFATTECRYRLPQENFPGKPAAEDGCVIFKNEDGEKRLTLYVSKTGVPASIIRHLTTPQASYANDIPITIYQNTASYGSVGVDDFMVTFKKDGLYYRLLTTDMTLTQLVAVLEELVGGAFSKTTRATTATTEPTPYISETNFTTTETMIPTTTSVTTVAESTTTETTAPTTTTAVQEEFPGVVVNAGAFHYRRSILGLKSTEIIPSVEFLEKYPITLPSGFATTEYRYRLPDERVPGDPPPEDGFVRCEKGDGTSSLFLYVGKTAYPATNLYSGGKAQASYINDTPITIRQNTADYGFMGVGDFMATYQKDGLYYRLLTTDMTLVELVAVLEELIGGEFSKTTRATTTTTPYVSETQATMTTASQNG